MSVKLRYETLMLTVPEITQDESKALETIFDRTVQASKGAMVSFERWGKYRLAYPVNKNEYGVYFLARFEVTPASKLVDEIRTLFAIKLNDVVMRSVTTRLEEKDPLTYQRPKSLEEMPTSREGGSYRDRDRSERGSYGDRGHRSESYHASAQEADGDMEMPVADDAE
jgi:small subunit ribosomal protein S6